MPNPIAAGVLKWVGAQKYHGNVFMFSVKKAARANSRPDLLASGDIGHRRQQRLVLFRKREIFSTGEIPTGFWRILFSRTKKSRAEKVVE